jgi:hypothetical protein
MFPFFPRATMTDADKVKPPRLYRHRRPEERLSKVISLSLTPPDAERLLQLAGANGTTRQDMLRQLIRLGHSAYFDSPKS